MTKSKKHSINDDDDNNRKRDATTPQNAIRGITNALRDERIGENTGTEQVEKKLVYSQNEISNEVLDFVGTKEYRNSKELGNVTIYADDGETMDMLDTLLNRAEALREMMEQTAPIIASNIQNVNTQSNDDPNAPMPNYMVVTDNEPLEYHKSQSNTPTSLIEAAILPVAASGLHYLPRQQTAALVCPVDFLGSKLLFLI